MLSDRKQIVILTVETLRLRRVLREVREALREQGMQKPLIDKITETLKIKKA